MLMKNDMYLNLKILHKIKALNNINVVHQLIKIIIESIKNIVKIKITLIFVSKNQIYNINKKYRKKNNITDIISFCYNNKILLKNNTNYIGDIIICLSTLQSFHKKNKDFFEDKCLKILIHGILHLLGFDHKNYYEYRKMQQIEKQIILKIKYIYYKKLNL